MDFHDGGVDHGVLHVRIIRGGIEKPFENIGFYPVSKPLEDGVPAAELGRKIAPRAAGSRDPQHRLDKPAVVIAAATGVGFLPPAMRFHLCPLGVAQHISVHPKLESQYLAWGNPKSQQTLGEVVGETDLYTEGRFAYHLLMPFTPGQGSRARGVRIEATRLCIHPVFSRYFSCAGNPHEKSILPQGAAFGFDAADVEQE